MVMVNRGKAAASQATLREVQKEMIRTLNDAEKRPITNGFPSMALSLLSGRRLTRHPIRAIS